MRKTHYKRERTKLEEKQAGLQAELERVQRRIDALDVVWNEIFNGSEPEHHENTGIPAEFEEVEVLDEFPKEEASQPAPARVGQAIEATVSQMSDEFGVKEVAEMITVYLDDVPERATIAGKLKKMADDGKLKLVVQGRGRRPSSYRRIS